MVNRNRILSRDEVSRVLAYLAVWADRRESERLNRVIFRLSAGCGLRCLEIQGLKLQDVAATNENDELITDDGAHITIPCGITKGRSGERKSRSVPLNWDRGTLQDIAQWYLFRRYEMGAGEDDPFVCGMKKGYRGRAIGKKRISLRWRGLIRRSLGPRRARQLGIHSGRRTFVTHALHVGRKPAAVRDAAGHSSLAVTCLYAGVLDSPDVPDLFGDVGPTSMIRRLHFPRQVTAPAIPPKNCDNVLESLQWLN